MQIKNVKVAFLEESILASGYPMQIGEPAELYYGDGYLDPDAKSDKDYNRSNKLANTPVGSGHNNFLKGIIVQFDMKYPQYLFNQLDRYNFWDDISDGILPKTTDVMDIVSSQSKMHKLTSINNIGEYCNKYVVCNIINEINNLIWVYNNETFPCIYIDNSGEDEHINSKQECFQYIISNLPMGYELWMRVSMNYLQIKNIYQQRKSHKVDDWKYFCDWVKTLPMAEELIINGDKTNK